MRNKTRKTKVLIAFLAVSLILLTFLLNLGCASTKDWTSSIEDSDVINKENLRRVIRLAVVIYAGDDLERINRSLEVIEDVRSYVDNNEEVSVDKLGDKLRQEILWEKLDPVEATVAEELLLVVENRIRAKIDADELEATVETTFGDVLNWALDVLVLSKEKAKLAGYGVSSKPVDMSLYGWLTNKETRQVTRDYYKKERAPEGQVKDFKKLRALEKASEDGNINHKQYRRYVN